MNDVEQSKATLADLEARKRAALAGLAKAEDRRPSLSYDAMIGGATAKKELAAANADRASQEVLIADLGVAIGDARERVAIAEKAAARADLVRRAEAARLLVDPIAAAARDLDTALATSLELKRKFESLIGQARALGVPIAAPDLVEVNLRRASDTAMLAFHPKAARAVAPGDRRPFAYFGASWSAMVSAWSGRVLSGEQGSPPAPAAESAAVSEPATAEAAAEPPEGRDEAIEEEAA